MHDQSSPDHKPFSAPKRRLWTLTGIFFIALFISFLLQLPTWRAADWGQFAFYDPGTTLKGDALLAKGYIPTIDFGYTHGLLSLLYGRLGFALLGRTPGAFLVLTLLTELVMAWAIARILVAAGISRKGMLVLLAALPMAIMPAYLTLTHPLEAMFILLGLAAQAEGKRAQALALATICLFVKPSMAYVYGFLLTVIIIWNIVRHTRVTWSERILSILRQLLPAALVGFALYIALSLWMGPTPVIRTLLPFTGAKTYAATHFGFFTTETAREFWFPGTLGDLFTTPAFAYLLSATASALGAIWAARMLIRRQRVPAAEIVSRQRAWELLLTAGLLNSAFLLFFYGWTGSWTYYSYLPCLGLAAVTVLVPVRRNARLIIAITVIALLLLSNAELVGTIYAAWHDKTRTPDSAGLWTYPEQFTQWQEALQSSRNQKTLALINGWIPQLPPNVSLPDAWFPEPGIPTPSELQRIRQQVQSSQCLILWWEYRRFDVWNSPELTPLHNDFTPVFTSKWFTVLQRTTPQSSTQ